MSKRNRKKPVKRIRVKASFVRRQRRFESEIRGLFRDARKAGIELLPMSPRNSLRVRP